MDKETLDKISAMTRRRFKAEELYTFPVVLCHNDIDRDGERFSDAALDEMQPLFIGKAGIFDHNVSAENQSARIYDTEVVEDPERTTAWGGTYRYLKGYAYMVRTDSNKDFITEIDAGIKKEVSVSCSVSRRLCSVCGAKIGTGCEHEKGKSYDGQICHTVLEGVEDAYEWSFVAVPAQVGAGVTAKHYKDKGGIKMDEFTPITTQAAFDAAVQETVKQAVDEAVSEAVKQYEGYISPEDHQKALDDQAAVSKSLLLAAYRTKAALKSGLPEELAERLTGDTEEELTADAVKLAKFASRRMQDTPGFQPGTPVGNSTDAAFMTMLDQITN